MRTFHNNDKVKRYKVFASILFTVMLMFAAFSVTVPTQAASRTPSKVTGVSIKNVNGVNKLSWKSTKNAKKYEVYRASSSKGKYTRVKTTTAKSFSETRKGMSYYKVRGVNGSKKGSFSSPVAMYSCKAYIAGRGNAGWAASGSLFRVIVANQGSSSMTYKGFADSKGKKYNIWKLYVMDRKTKKAVHPTSYLDYMYIKSGKYAYSMAYISSADGGQDIKYHTIKPKKTGYITVTAPFMMGSYVAKYDNTSKYRYYIGTHFTAGGKKFAMRVSSYTGDCLILPE